VTLDPATMTPPAQLMIVSTGLQTGGAERMLVKLMARIDRQYYNPVVVSLTGPGTQGEHLRQLGIECLYPPAPGIGGLLVLLWSALKRVGRQRPALIQGWMYHGCVFATAVHVLARCRVPLLWNIRHSIHDVSSETRSLRAVLRALAFLSRRVALCIYPSKVALGQHAALGIRCMSALVLPNGFELDRFNIPHAPQRTASRRRMGLQPDEHVLINVARYHPMKDHACLLRAFAAALRRAPRLRLVLVGDGLTAANDALMESIKSLSLSQQVVLLGELGDVRDALAGADIFCLSSKWGEAFPNALGEAMAMGLPAVCTDVGDCREILGAGGLVISPGDPVGLADAIVQLALATEEERQRIGRRARARVVEHYAIGACVAAYERAYAAQLAPRRADASESN
jgi:glycosyltransferase involved in cell wall biosynthesis